MAEDVGVCVLSDYARKHASLKTGRGEAGKLSELDESIEPQAEVFEKHTRNLAQAADRILHKHGKNIVGKQFASKRNLRRIDNNDDELLKALAVDALEVERFRWDTI